jgi:hypothetical protein
MYSRDHVFCITGTAGEGAIHQNAEQLTNTIIPGVLQIALESLLRSRITVGHTVHSPRKMSVGGWSSIPCLLCMCE